MGTYVILLAIIAVILLGIRTRQELNPTLDIYLGLEYSSNKEFSYTIKMLWIGFKFLCIATLTVFVIAGLPGMH